MLTRLELPVGAWELGLNESVRRASLPDVNRARPAALSIGAVLFLAVAMLVPLPERAVTSVNAAAASRVAQLEAHAEALAREEPLEESVEAELARLREELAAGEFDATDWEAADHLEGALARNAAEAQAELGRAAEAAEALERALEKSQGGDAAARERDALERALMAMDENSGSGPEALEKALAQAGENGAESGNNGENAAKRENGGKREQGGQGEADGPSKSEVAQLRDALRDRQERMAKAFGQETGDQRRASNQGSPRRGQGQGQGQGEGEGEGKGQGQGEGAAQGKGQATGERGGPSRGGGEGELRFDQPVEMDPERLAFAPLPEGQGGDPGELWGLKAADPKPSNEPSSGGASAGSVARGEQAPAFDQSARLPRNRELVRRYFDSEQ